MKFRAFQFNDEDILHTLDSGLLCIHKFIQERTTATTKTQFSISQLLTKIVVSLDMWNTDNDMNYKIKSYICTGMWILCG